MHQGWRDQENDLGGLPRSGVNASARNDINLYSCCEKRQRGQSRAKPKENHLYYSDVRFSIWLSRSGQLNCATSQELGSPCYMDQTLFQTRAGIAGYTTDNSALCS